MDQYGIRVLPISLIIDGKAYLDGVDMTPAQAYEWFQKDPKSFHTSAPSPGLCLQVFSEIGRQYQNIICITVSSKLSGVFNSAVLAREQLRTEMPELTIEVMDSHTATASEGMIALAAARAARNGNSLADVKREAVDVQEKVNTLVLLDTIKHVYRSGRIPKIASDIGAVLNLRPMFGVKEEVFLVTLATTREGGISRIFKTMRETLGDRPSHVAVMHAYAPEKAAELRDRIQKEFKCEELWLTEFSPVMGYATGTGTLGVSFY